MRSRIVITGMGCHTPVGNTLKECWANIVSGHSGIAPITKFDASQSAVTIAGEVRDFDIAQYMPARDGRRLDLFTQYFLASGTDALRHAGLLRPGLRPDDPPLSGRLRSDIPADRVGVLAGSAIGGIITLADNALLNAQSKKLSPFFVPSALINIAAGVGSMAWGAKGVNFGLASACASSTHAIGLACRLLDAGDADIIVAGGAEASIDALPINGHVAMKALSTKRNGDPTRASRPWDKDRDGFVMGEGSGAVVLERLEHALARGATIWAEVIGFGMSGDSHHLTSPSDNGEGAARCMRLALQDANLSPSDIQHINAHATSTPLGDVAEVQAIRSVFGSHTDHIHVTATKSMTGHLLGGAGVTETIFTTLALHHQIVPPTINCDHPSSDCDLMVAAHHAVPRSDLQAALTNSFGFGGTNASLVLRRYPS